VLVLYRRLLLVLLSVGRLLLLHGRPSIDSLRLLLSLFIPLITLLSRRLSLIRVMPLSTLWRRRMRLREISLRLPLFLSLLPILIVGLVTLLLLLPSLVHLRLLLLLLCWLRLRGWCRRGIVSEEV
jgi:hypothetical protein